MNAAATRIRAIPAPMLNDCGPHNGAPEVAATFVTSPSPFTPWQRAQVRRYAVLPLAVSAGSGPMESMPAPGSRRPAAEALESHDIYATMSRMSSPSNASGVPFKLRRKQSLMRFSIRPTFPERERYCGKRACTPAHGMANARVPSSRWHDTQRRPLPTLRGRESRVACRSARPRRTDCENGSFRSVDSAGTVMWTTAMAGARTARTGFSPPHAAANATTAISAGLVMKRLSDGGDVPWPAPPAWQWWHCHRGLAIPQLGPILGNPSWRLEPLALRCVAQAIVERDEGAGGRRTGPLERGRKLQRVGRAQRMQSQQAERLLAHAIARLHLEPARPERVEQRARFLLLLPREVTFTVQPRDGRRTFEGGTPPDDRLGVLLDRKSVV